MLHRIEWVEHSSKRDGKTCLAFQSCAWFCNSLLSDEHWCFCLLLDPDNDDDTKRNNKCWLVWEVRHMIAFAPFSPCCLLALQLTWISFWSTSIYNNCHLLSRGQRKSVVLGIWNSNSVPQRVWPGNTSRSMAQNTTGTWLSAWASWKPRMTDLSLWCQRSSHPLCDSPYSRTATWLPLTRDRNVFHQ